MRNYARMATLKKGVIAGTNPVNKIIERLNQCSPTISSVEEKNWVFPTRAGYIVSAGPNGEADFTDNMYWVSIASVTNGINQSTGQAYNSPNTDTVIVTQYSVSSNYYEIIPVCNLSEQPAGSHSLATDGSVPVLVQFCDADLNGTDDLTVPTRFRYCMVYGGSGGSVGTGQYQGMAYMNVTQNQMGSSYPFAHELV